MKALELVARTFSVQLPDGRIIFRPWGSRGPCYLLSAPQRAARARLQLAFYVLAVGTFCLFPGIISSALGMISFVIAFTLLGWALFWAFSVGLPTTAKPPTPTPDQRRMAIAAHSRALGRPLLWILAVISWLFVLTGALMMLLLREWAMGLLVLVFFGACAATFTWQLVLVRRATNA